METTEQMRILFADDDPAFREMMTEILVDAGYKVIAVENGKLAEEYIYRDSFDLYLIDYNMPVLDGEQFVARLKRKEPQAIVIMLTGVSEADRIVNIMKLGVFDYLMKPAKINKIEETIAKAIDFKKTLQEQYERQLQAAKEIQGKVLWNEYKKNALDSTTSVTREVLENMRRNLLQGSGIGSQISMINLLDVMKGEKDSEENYKIPADIIDLLVGNSIYSQRQLSTLTNTLAILSNNSFVLTQGKVSDLLQHIKSNSNKIKSIALAKKNSEFHFEHIHQDAIVVIDLNYLTLAFEELLINASKYSSHSAPINIYTYIKDGFYFISVKNSINSEDEGVPAQYERLVLEPFFRLSKESEDSHLEYEEKYSTGLGLCVVDYIIKKHNGLFWIKNFKDHLNTHSGLCTIAEVGLPIERII
jgi:DNA-binding response OmpR family regulator